LHHIIFGAREIRWAGHVACGCMRDRRGTYSGLAGKERDHVEDLYLDERIILKCNFKKRGWGRGVGLHRYGSG